VNEVQMAATQGPGDGGYHPRLLAVTPIDLRQLLADIEAEASLPR
jgi:hypothetical protein